MICLKKGKEDVTQKRKEEDLSRKSVWPDLIFGRKLFHATRRTHSSGFLSWVDQGDQEDDHSEEYDRLIRMVRMVGMVMMTNCGRQTLQLGPSHSALTHTWAAPCNDDDDSDGDDGWWLWWGLRKSYMWTPGWYWRKLDCKISDSFELKKGKRHGGPPRVLCMLVPVQIILWESLKHVEMLCSSYWCNLQLRLWK